jgi:hypothetical protein
MIAEEKIPAPFPDIAAEAPGILTEQEEMMGANKVIQSEREPSDEERAMFAAANSGIDFSAPPEDCPTKREIIKILDGKDDDILDQHINEESIQRQYEDKLPKIEEDNDMSEEAVESEDENRRLKRNRTANRQYQDYELCVTVEEQEDRPDYEESQNNAKRGALRHDALCREGKHKKETKKEI